MTDATNKAPCYPWYPRDFLADEPVQLMTLAEEGAYRRLLDHQWLHGSVPGSMESLSRICKNISEREMRKIWPKIEPLFVRMEGQPIRLQNRRMERVRSERKAFLDKQSESGKRGAEARWGKHGVDGEPKATPSATPMADECLASASAVASAVGTSLPADAVSLDVTDGQIMAAIREHLYAPDGKPPEGWVEGREFSIMRQLRKLGKSGTQILAVVEGLGELRRDGRVDWLKGKATLRAVYNSKTGCLDMWGQAEDAYYKLGMKMGEQKKSSPKDVRNDFLRAAEQYRAKAAN